MTCCIILWNYVNRIILETATTLHEYSFCISISCICGFVLRCSKRATILHLDLALKILALFRVLRILLGWKDYVDWLPSDCVQQSSKCRGLGWLTATLGVLDPLKDCGVGYFLCWFGLLGDGFIRPTFSSTKGSGKSWSWAFISLISYAMNEMESFMYGTGTVCCKMSMKLRHFCWPWSRCVGNIYCHKYELCENHV